MGAFTALIVGASPVAQSTDEGKAPETAIGIVTDEEGNPVPDAVVVLYGRPDPHAPLAAQTEEAMERDRTRTGPRGRFTLPRPSTGFFALRAETDDARSKIHRLPIPGVPLRLELRPLRTIHGEVHDAADAPVAGCRITVAADPVEHLAAVAPRLSGFLHLDETVATTDERGSFTLRTAQPGGAPTVLATPAGQVLRELPDEGPWQLKLDPVDRVLITVLDAEGEPVSGATVDRPFTAPGLRRELTTDADGFVEFENLGKPLYLEVRSGEHGTLRGIAEHFGRRLRKELTLEPLRTIQFRLVDGLDRPVAGREVLACGSIPLAFLDGRDLPGATTQLTRAARTDANGRVTLRYPFDPESRTSLWIEGGARPWSLAHLHVDPDALDGADLHLPATASIDGTVFDPEGVPCAGVAVVIVPALDPVLVSTTDSDALRMTISDSAGRFRFDGVESGMVGLTTLDTRFLPAWDTITVRPDAARRSFDLHQREGRRMAGRVLDRSGVPVAGARIMVETVGDLTSRRGPLIPLALGAISDADGSFSVPIEDGETEVMAWCWTFDGRNGVTEGPVPANLDQTLELVVR